MNNIENHSTVSVKNYFILIVIKPNDSDDKQKILAAKFITNYCATCHYNVLDLYHNHKNRKLKLITMINDNYSNYLNEIKGANNAILM